MCPQPPQNLPKHCSASLAAPDPPLPWDGAALWSSCTPENQWTEISWQQHPDTSVVYTLNTSRAANVVLDFKMIFSSVATTRESYYSSRVIGGKLLLFVISWLLCSDISVPSWDWVLAVLNTAETTLRGKVLTPKDLCRQEGHRTNGKGAGAWPAGHHRRAGDTSWLHHMSCFSNH